MMNTSRNLLPWYSLLNLSGHSNFSGEDWDFDQEFTKTKDFNKKFDKDFDKNFDKNWLSLRWRSFI